MTAVLSLLAQSPAPTEEIEYPDPVLVTPGTIGFLVTLFIAVAVVLLVRDALRRVRRVRARDRAVDRYPIPMRRAGEENQPLNHGHDGRGGAIDHGADERTEAPSPDGTAPRADDEPGTGGDPRER